VPEGQLADDQRAHRDATARAFRDAFKGRCGIIPALLRVEEDRRDQATRSCPRASRSSPSGLSENWRDRTACESAAEWIRTCTMIIGEGSTRKDDLRRRSGRKSCSAPCSIWRPKIARTEPTDQADLIARRAS